MNKTLFIKSLAIFIAFGANLAIAAQSAYKNNEKYLIVADFPVFKRETPVQSLILKKNSLISICSTSALDIANAEKIAADKIATEKSEAHEAVSTKIPTDQAAIDQAAAEKTVADKVAKDKADAYVSIAGKIATDKAEVDKAEAEKISAEKAAVEKAAAYKAATEKVPVDKAAVDKAAIEKVAAEKAATDKAAIYKIAAEKSSDNKIVTFKIEILKAGGQGTVTDKNKIYGFNLDDNTSSYIKKTESSWNYKVQLGQIMSTYSGASNDSNDNDDDVFTNTSLMAGITGEQKFDNIRGNWGSISFIENVRFGQKVAVTQKQTEDSTASDITSTTEAKSGLLSRQSDNNLASPGLELIKDADVIDTQFSVKKDCPIFSFWYIKATAGFLIANDSRVQNDFYENYFVGFGLQQDDPDSAFYKSYIEAGPGYSERFKKNEYRPFKCEAMIFYKLQDLGWEAFLNMRIDSGKKADDFQAAYGIQRNIDFVFDSVSKVFTNVVGSSAQS